MSGIGGKLNLEFQDVSHGNAFLAGEVEGSPDEGSKHHHRPSLRVNLGLLPCGVMITRTVRVTNVGDVDVGISLFANVREHLDSRLITGVGDARDVVGTRAAWVTITPSH